MRRKNDGSEDAPPPKELSTVPYSYPFACGATATKPLEIALDKKGTSLVGLSDLDEALSRLETMEKPKAEVVELKFFGGLSHDKVAEVMGCPERTVRRHWKVAKMWLYRELKQAVTSGP